MITQAELQDDLLRFESQFNARIQSAGAPLEASGDPALRYRAAMNRLIYSSSALNIALGPVPEANLLDMVTFIELSHGVLQRHWIPKLFGSEGKALDSAFTDSKRQIWAIAGKVLNEEQKRLLREVISVWHARHPEQVNVETVRLSAFSTEAGAKAAGIDQNVGGLFSSVQQNTEAVDSALLFAERALYFAERLPFLIRHQARLGAHEIIDDTGLRLARLPDWRREERGIRAILREFQQIVKLTQAMFEGANSAMSNFKSLSGKLSRGAGGGTNANLSQVASLLGELNQLLRTAISLEGSLKPEGVAGFIDQRGGFVLERLAWLGAGLILLFWVMYIVAKLTYRLILHHYLSAPEKSEHRRAA